MDEDRKYEKLGEIIFSATYWLFALRIILAVAVPCTILMIAFHKPFWIGSLMGIGAWLVYRTIRRFVFRILIKLGRWSNEK